ncbi:hypothetical protein ACIBAB_21265 [Streptomyces rubiginosohelvolus]|uniref:hypothetical protein n=1 Tax=Streptomyces TaxID=1883 RepID=UPI0037AB222E
MRSALGFGLAWINPFCAFYAAVGCFDVERLVPRRWIPLGLLATAVTIAGAQNSPGEILTQLPPVLPC